MTIRELPQVSGKRYVETHHRPDDPRYKTTEDISSESFKRRFKKEQRRLSTLCPVIRRINGVLDREKPKSVQKAIDILIEDLESMPNGFATQRFLMRMRDIGEGKE